MRFTNAITLLGLLAVGGANAQSSSSSSSVLSSSVLSSASSGVSSAASSVVSDATSAAAGVATDSLSASASSASSDSISSTATASAALASASVAPVSTALIPGNISTTCSTFLNALNVDGNFTQCMQPLVNLTNAYAPSADGSSTNATTNQQITSTLTTLCASSSGCSDALVRSYLASFYSECAGELTGANGAAYNDQVRELYDFLYVLQPFRGAVCARDSGSAKYCVLEIANAALGAANNATASRNVTGAATNGTSLIALNSYATYASLAQEILGPVAQAAANLVVYTKTSAKRALSIRDATTQTSGIAASLISPNTTTYRTTSLPYLFLQPNMTSTLLCTTCTKVVMAAYASWEAQIPYALGLSSSPILGSQAALWQGISATCGQNFTDAITSLAGILAANGTVVAATSGATSNYVSMAPIAAAFVAIALMI